MNRRHREESPPLILIVIVLVVVFGVMFLYDKSFKADCVSKGGHTRIETGFRHVDYDCLDKEGRILE